MERSWAASSTLAEARAALQLAERDEGSRVAYEFLNDGELADPVADAKAAVASAQAEVERLDGRVKPALLDEAHYIERELQRLRTERAKAITLIIAASPHLQRLREEHKAAWKELRTVRALLQALLSATHGQWPREMETALAVEPLEADRVGFEVDSARITALQSALVALETDAGDHVSRAYEVI